MSKNIIIRGGPLDEKKSVKTVSTFIQGTFDDDATNTKVAFPKGVLSYVNNHKKQLKKKRLMELKSANTLNANDIQASIFEGEQSRLEHCLDNFMKQLKRKRVSKLKRQGPLKTKNIRAKSNKRLKKAIKDAISIVEENPLLGGKIVPKPIAPGEPISNTLDEKEKVSQTGMMTSSKPCKLDGISVLEARKRNDKLLKQIRSRVLVNIKKNNANVFQSFMGEYLKDLPDRASRSQVVDEIIATFQRKQKIPCELFRINP